MEKTNVLLFVVSVVIIVSTLSVLAAAVALSHARLDSTGLPKHKTIVIEPEFTEAAYQKGGWYDNPQITSITLNDSEYWRTKYGGSYYGFSAINSTTAVDTTTDVEVTMHPGILGAYDRVILLHNEYVSKTEYGAIMNHSNVFYAYPNALYRFVTYTGNITADDTGTITLGPYTGNPFSFSIWGKVSEYKSCASQSYKVVKYPNGTGLTCYPEHSLHDPKLIGIVLGNVTSASNDTSIKMG